MITKTTLNDYLCVTISLFEWLFIIKWLFIHFIFIRKFLKPPSWRWRLHHHWILIKVYTQLLLHTVNF